jgi:hypothetical protein
MMKLFTKVNPDMMPAVPPPMPTIDIIPGMGGDKSMGPPEMKPINKLLPDFDADNDDMPGGEIDLPPDHDKDHAMIKTLDKDDDGDHDMDDHKKEKEESWKNEPDEEYRDIGAAIHDGTDEHREKGTYPKVAGGDNPMQKFRESENLRAQIRDDLRRRLAEAKGAK